jgi:exodeoxyribonuclease-3
VRLVAWNCRSAFHRKFECLLDLAPDVAVVAECANLELLGRDATGLAPTSAVWVGSNPRKGLGVFSFGPYRLMQHRRYDPAITYALPIRVEGPTSFRLLAVWAHYGLAPLRMSTLGPTLLALATYRRFLREQPSIVAGDLNNHVRWDKPKKAWSHANAVAAFDRLGLVSAYHVFEGVDHGAERHPTFYWRTRSTDGPTYHIDYVFVPRASLGGLRSVSVGARSEWIATGLSDHAPVMVEVDL